MGKRVLLTTIHGMGETNPAYWQPLVHSLREAVPASSWARIAIVPIHYQPVIQHNQEALYSRILLQHKLRYQSARRFFLYAFGDAATLEHHSDRPGSPYLEAQRVIRSTLRSAMDQLEIKSAPVICIAHSLGCQVLSNFLWDAQHGMGIDASDPDTDATPAERTFQTLGTLRLLLTTGCNIPLFVSGLDEIIAINKPTPHFQWHNFLDVDDVLAWPLKPLSHSYDRLVTADHEINAGNALTSWNPASHTGYWTDRDFIRPAARLIETVAHAA